MKPFLLLSSFAIALAATTPASAHITLQTGAAAVGSYYKAVLQVPHGCKGAATTAIKIRIPEGVISVKPQPKAGWKIDMARGDYAADYTLHGAKVTSGVKELSWTGGPLPDDYYDEFVFHAYLTPGLKAGDKLYFPVVQECEQGVDRWIDTSGAKGVENPAPSLKLTPKASGHHH
ncbi:MAG: DUF1775 domain-containing protein [Alcaligenaceae bacterium]|nr:DUF1775 domain-containing protein [Alcaligenaceae bacterium]